MVPIEDFLQDKLIKGRDAACRRIMSEAMSRSGLSAYKITSDLMERQIKEISTKEIGRSLWVICKI
jgi:transcriptional regulator NrdR family protein